MPTWSREEVEATVKDYFSMLYDELTGLPYSKTEHRRRLLPLLNERSAGAVERKHQNISAVLIELGFPYISGYKPLSNYQELLREVVADHLFGSRALIDIVESEVDKPAAVPLVDDILQSLEPPPKRTDDNMRQAHDRSARIAYSRPRVDYLAREAANIALGAAGEEFVVRYEKARLIHLGCDQLASAVEHVSVTAGDGMGYDIKSFESDGSDRFIEVKTTGYGKNIPFFVTRNEVLTSTSYGQRYHLYRVFHFRQRPRLYDLRGSLTDTCRLEPTIYEASP